MSQLNNNENEKEIKEPEETEKVEETKEVEESKEVEKKPKKKLKVSTKIIIFLVVFTIVCVGTTVVLIFMKNAKNNVQEEEVVIKEGKEIYRAEDDGLGIKSLTERYKGNDLETETVNDKIGTREPTYEYDSRTYKIGIEYISIDGLKNEEIENKINKELKDKAYSLYTQEELNNSNIDSIGIYEYEKANFGNILSVQINKNIRYKKADGEYKHDGSTEYLNYDLNTGNQILFKELFTNKTSMKNVLIPAINKMLRDRYMSENRNDDMMSVDFKKMDLSAIEEETYVILNKIMKDIDNVKFGFSCQYIYIPLDNEIITIDMPTIYRNIAIYKRFMTENSIFDGRYNSRIQNSFVFTEMYSELYDENWKTYSKIEDIYDNLRVEAKIRCSNVIYEEKEGKEIYNEYVEILNNQIGKLKTEAKNNPEKQILYVAEYYIDGSEDKRLNKVEIKNIMTHTSGYARIYRMDKKYYDETFYEEMAEQHRNNWGMASEIISYYVEEDNSNVTVEEIMQEYQTFDLFTNRTYDELMGINELENIVKELEKQRDAWLKGGKIYSYISDNPDSFLKSRFDSVKSKYGLKDYEEVIELETQGQKLVDEIKELKEKEKKEKESMQNTSKVEQEKNTENTIKPKENTISNKAIVGDWEYKDGGYTYHFNEDGTGTYMGTMNLTYTENNGVIKITFDGMDNSLEGTWEGNVLNVKDSFGSDTIYYKK